MARRNFRLAVCTGGGDCPGLNAAIRAVVRSAIGEHGMEVVGIRDGLTGLMSEPAAIVPLSIAATADILARGGTILGTSNQGSPFRDEESSAVALSAIKKAVRAQKIDALVVIGGDGTQLMARALSDAGINVVGVPKTIDNDLVGSSRTIGFATAVEIAMEAGERLLSSADAHNRIMVLEVMGRDAGHIALQSALACGAQFSLIPEIAFDYDVLTQKIMKQQKLTGRAGTLVVVAEGAMARGTQPNWQEAASGTKVLGGIGQRVAVELHRRTGVDARATILGHIQRGGTPNVEDRLLAIRLAHAAIAHVAAEEYGHIVGIRDDKIVKIPYAKVRDARRGVNLDSELVRAAEGIGLSFGRPSSFKEA